MSEVITKKDYIEYFVLQFVIGFVLLFIASRWLKIPYLYSDYPTIVFFALGNGTGSCLYHYVKNKIKKKEDYLE